MSKKLKIQFWRAELALAMQILEQEGLPKNFIGLNVNIIDAPFLGTDWIDLRGSWINKDNDVAIKLSSTNAERDAYLDKIVNAITDELFAGEGELKIGEMCEMRDAKSGFWEKRKLLAILPEQYDERFIAENIYDSTLHVSWNYARPLSKRTKPTIEECGSVITYTWEEK